MNFHSSGRGVSRYAPTLTIPQASVRVGAEVYLRPVLECIDHVNAASSRTMHSILDNPNLSFLTLK
jgi:hypothetical protein